MVTDSHIASLQLILDVLPGQVAILGRDGRLVLVSRSWEAAGAGHLMARGIAGDDYLAGCDALQVRGIRDVLHGESEEFSFDYPGIVDSRVRWFNVRYRPFNNPDVCGALVTHEDISDRIESELARSESDRLLNSLIDASPLAIISIDTQCRVTRWNPAAERMFGWPADEVLGTINPVIPEEQRATFFDVMASELRLAEGVTVEGTRYRKDGTTIEVQISRAGIFAADGRLRGAVAIIKDVTNEKREADQREFLSDVSQVLAGSLDYEATLAQVARMAVPRVADMCAVNLIDEAGNIRRLAAAHHDPEKDRQVQAFRQSFDIPANADWGSRVVLRTGVPEIRQWPDEPVEDESDQYQVLREIGLRSTLTVPLIAREQTIGTIVLVYGDSGRVYSEADLALALGLAERAAAAIDNARLYREARTAEQQYRTLVNHVPAITYTARADDLSYLTFISTQPQVQMAQGPEGGVVDGAVWQSRLHPDDAGRVRAMMDACSRTGDPLEVEYRIVRDDGTVAWRLDRANLIHDDRGTPLHWQGVVVDITDRHATEAATRIRARQQAAVATLGQRIIGDVDLDGVITDSAEVIFETLHTEYVSIALYNPAHETLEIKATAGKKMPGDVSKVLPVDAPSLMTYTFQTRAPVIIEDLDDDNRFMPWQVMVDAGVRSGVSVVIPGPERPYGVIIAVTADKRLFSNDDVMFLQSISNLVSSAYEHFRDEEEMRFQAHLLDVISQAVVATDRDGRITHWNRHAEELYGWSRQEAMGQSILDVMPGEATFDQLSAIFAELLAGESWSGDFPLQRRDGSVFDGWVIFSPLRGDSGDVTGVVSVSADISDRVQAHAERERLLRALGERVKELTVLHQAAELFESDNQPLEDILTSLASMLPVAMQHPEKAAAKVQVGEHWAASAGYRTTPWAIRTELGLPGGDGGLIEVCYVDANPHAEEMLFLPEEYHLIETLGEMLLAYLQRVYSREQLLKSEARFRAATEGTLDAFGILEPIFGDSGVAHDYRFVEVNSRAEVLLKRSREELVGSTLYGLFLPQQAAMFVQAFNQVIQTGETLEREVEVPRESDSFWMLYQAVPLDDGVAAFASETTERRKLEEQLMHQAFHDALTGLPNRALFLDRVEHARTRVRRRHEGIAVLFLDLDNFKIINDSLGHAAGDELLIAVAERLKRCIGQGNTAARFGGDEFAILLEDLSDWALATDVAEHIVRSFDMPFEVMEREFFISPSIGVAISTSQDKSASDLLRDADAAMYRAKRNGKARVEVFDPSHASDVIARFELENDMRRAIDRGEFSVVYQPVVRMRDGDIVAMEALVRWDHPEHGTLSPGLFIPIAEETGMIIQIGFKVLGQACSDAVAWNRGRQVDERIKVSVNISARQFRHPVLVDQVINVLGSTGLPADQLYLEITESMMVDDISRARETLTRLRDLGVHIAVDDFGTGYSSLGSIRQFPVEVVKIDRSFVSGFDTNPQDAVMLASIIDLAHALELRVIAEGVETASERDRLRAMGCDLAQGYFYARPLPVADLQIETP